MECGAGFCTPRPANTPKRAPPSSIYIEAVGVFIVREHCWR